MKIFAGILLLIFLLIMLVAYIIVKSTCTGKREMPVPVSTPIRPDFAERITQGQQWFWSNKTEEREILSHDGLRLHGYYLQGSGKDTMILMHGYRSAAVYEFAPMVRFYHELGYSLLLPDQRAHGKSEGKYLSFGIKESRDVLSWIEHLNESEQPDNIFLAGVSMGGASVCMASLLELPPNVRGIIADCPFGDPGDQFAYSMSLRTRVPPRPMMYFCSIWTGILAGWKFSDVVKEDYAHARLPLLLLHGTADPTVPHYLSESIIAHYGGQKQYELFEDCAHVYAYMKDTPRYQRLVTQFLDKHSK